MEILRPYGAATPVYFPLIDAGANDFEDSPVTFAAGDVQLSKDGGAFANATNTPAHEGQGIYSLALTATEMGAATLVIAVIDQTSPKAWEDQCLLVGSYGHASARHETLPANVEEINGNAVEHSSGYLKVKDASGNDVAPDADADEILTRLPDASPGGAGGLPTVDASNRVAGVQGTKNTLDDLNDFDPATEQVDVGKVEGQALSAKAGDNFDAFFHNAGADTAKVVDDVGGSGSADWSSTEREQLRHRLGVDGTATAPTANEPHLGEIEADVTKIDGNAVEHTDGYLHVKDASGEDVAPDADADAILAKLDLLVGVPVIIASTVVGTGQDIGIYRGDTAAIAFALGRDITGATLAFTVKRRHSDAQGAALITKTTAEVSEIEITDAEAGEFDVKLAAGDTSGLLPDGRAVTFVYDVEMTLSGVVETVAAGDFLVAPDVTTS